MYVEYFPDECTWCGSLNLRSHTPIKGEQDLILIAAEQAAEAFGGGDGTFNAAGFSNCMMKLVNLRGTIDGNLVRAILSGRPDIEFLAPGDSHYRLRSTKNRVDLLNESLV